MTFSTSPTSSGSRAEVTSSKSMTFGRMAQRAGDRHALLLAAGELRGIVALLVGEADHVEELGGARLGLGLRHAEDGHRRLDAVLRAPSCAGRG